MWLIKRILQIIQDSFGANNKCQQITRGIFYCRARGGFNVSAPNKLPCSLIDQCFEIGNKDIPPSVTSKHKEKNMRKLILTLLILGFVVTLSGQEIELLGHYSGSNYNIYQNNLGYGIGYYHITKSTNKIGFIFQHSFYNKGYSEIYPSSEDGISTYIVEIVPKNQRIALKMNYAFNTVKHANSSLFIGPEIGVNYFPINEQVMRYEHELISAANYQSEYQRIIN